MIKVIDDVTIGTRNHDRPIDGQKSDGVGKRETNLSRFLIVGHSIFPGGKFFTLPIDANFSEIRLRKVRGVRNSV